MIFFIFEERQNRSTNILRKSGEFDIEKVFNRDIQILVASSLRYIFNLQRAMKVFVLLLALLALAAANFAPATCPHDLEVRCIDDINKAFPVCEKAAKEKGADVPMDLECFKYFASMEKDCWPCICWVAEMEHWKIKGC